MMARKWRKAESNTNTLKAGVIAKFIQCSGRKVGAIGNKGLVYSGLHFVSDVYCGCWNWCQFESRRYFEIACRLNSSGGEEVKREKIAFVI